MSQTPALRHLLRSVATRRSYIQHQRKAAARLLIASLMAEGVTQTKMAEHIGLTQAAISNNFHGITTPSLTTIRHLMRLAEMKGLPIPKAVAQWQEL